MGFSLPSLLKFEVDLEAIMVVIEPAPHRPRDCLTLLLEILVCTQIESRDPFLLLAMASYCAQVCCYSSCGSSGKRPSAEHLDRFYLSQGARTGRVKQ